MRSHCLDSLFFFNDTATTEIYTLSLHDALPIFVEGRDRLLLIIDHALQVLNRGGERVLQAVGERGELAHPLLALLQLRLKVSHPGRDVADLRDHRVARGP